MTEALSFEVLSLKGRTWETESVFESKEEALLRAREVLDRRHYSAVKVIGESYDEATGESRSFIVFNEKKILGKKKSGYTGADRRKDKEWRTRPKKPGRGKERRNKGFVGEIVKLVVILGGILFGLIFLVLVYISYGG